MRSRKKKIINRFVRYTRIAGEAKEMEKWARYGVTGVGIGLAGGGRMKTGVAIGALGIAGHFAFKKLEAGIQKRLIASLVGRPKLTDAVCRQVSEPDIGRKLRALGKIYLPKKQMRELRQTLLKKRKFDYPEFLADVKPLLELGSLREQYKGLTDASVKTATEAIKTKLDYPLSVKGKRAARLAIEIIKLVKPRDIRLTAAREITRGVIKELGPTNKAVDIILHLIRKAAAVPLRTEITSTMFGPNVKLRVYQTGKINLKINQPQKNG